MKTETYTCDVCEKVKNEANHWFGVRFNRELATVLIMPFSKIPAAEIALFEHVCGADHLTTRVNAMAAAL